MPNSELSELIADVREQALYLQELGVEALATEISSEFKVQGSRSVERPALPKAVDPNFKSEISNPKASEVSKPKATGSRIASLPSLSGRAMRAPAGVAQSESTNQIDQNMLQKSNPVAGPSETLMSATPFPVPVSETIESIRADIGDCTRCKLHMGRTQIVHTTGNFNADLMFVGEAPGADEDEQGFPFVGRAGQLLTKIIEGIGITREQVCIGNINRCRPPGNRQPEPDETAQCRPFILREIAVVKPKVIVVLGATAAHNLLQVKTPISKLRGNFHDYFGVKVMPTFHPAYLLRDPHKKREVWDDMKMVRDYLNAS